MKIVHVVWGLAVGGIETMLANIANNQSSLGHDIHVMVINDLVDSEIIELFSSDVTIHRINRRIASKNPLKVLKMNLLMGKLNPNVVHFHGLNMPRLFLNKFVRRSCTTLHNDCEAFKLELHLAHKNNYFIGVTQAVADEIAAFTGKDAGVVINGINTGSILKKEDSFSGGILKIVQVGRLNHVQKGQNLLIEAVKILKDRGMVVNVDLIGEGNSRNYLESIVADLDLSSQIHFLGNKSQKYIFENLCHYDLFIQPSLYEGFGLTVAEAMAAKLPVLVSDIPPLLEVINNGEYGYIFASGDVNSLVDAIEHFASNSNHSKCEIAYKATVAKYDVKATAKNYIKEYYKICNL